MSALDYLDSLDPRHLVTELEERTFLVKRKVGIVDHTGEYIVLIRRSNIDLLERFNTFEFRTPDNGWWTMSRNFLVTNPDLLEVAYPNENDVCHWLVK